MNNVTWVFLLVMHQNEFLEKMKLKFSRKLKTLHAVQGVVLSGDALNQL